MEKNNLFEAVCTMNFSSVLQKPFIGFAYKNSLEIDKFYEKILTEIKDKYPMPFTMKNISTNPEIINIRYDIASNRSGTNLCTMIQYKTNINVHNVTALRKENDENQMKINDIYPNINKSIKMIVYTAINAYPQSGMLTPEIYQIITRN